MFTGIRNISDNARGSALMLLAMASFAIGDSFMKYIGVNLPLSQLLATRGAFAIVILLAITYFLGQLRPLSTMASPAFVLRIICEVAASFFYFTALFNMPLANTIAIMQALPLTVTVGAALFFGEQIGWRRISAILVGLIGVFLIVRPGFEGFTIYSVFTLCSVLAAATRDLATRKLPKELPTFYVSLITVIAVTLAALVYSPFEEWQPVDLKTFGLLGIASLFLISGFFGIVGSMRVGEVGFVTPFRYFILLFAVVIGFFIFNEIPDIYTVIGSVIVVGSGIYTVYRERILLRPIATGTTHAAEQ